MIFISPVSVVISHLPPFVDFGTLILPVSVFVKNVLPDKKEALTSPVSVLTKISPAFVMNFHPS